MIAYLLALLIWLVAGLRAFMVPAAAHLGWLRLGGTWLAFLGYRWTAWILTGSAIVDHVTDQLPSTSSRTAPVQFGARIVMDALSGAALGYLADYRYLERRRASLAR